MKTFYQVLYPGERADYTDVIDWPSEPGFAAIRMLVEPLLDNAIMEHVSVLYEGARCDMFVDEMGHSKGLMLNRIATKIYWAASLQREPDANTNAWPTIVGPAVLFERQIWF